MHNYLARKTSDNEWLEFISCLGLVNLEDARAVFYSDTDSSLSDIKQKTIYTAGRGKILSLEGNLPGAKLTFDEALQLAEDHNANIGFPREDEILAYVNYERAGFFQKYADINHAISLYRSARRMVESPNLCKTIEYQLYAMNFERGIQGSELETNSWINFFDTNGMKVMHLISLRRFSSYYTAKKDFEKSFEWINNAIIKATEFELSFMEEQFKNQRGYIFLKQGQFGKARQVFKDLLAVVQGNYLRSSILENMTLSYFNEHNFEAAAEYIDQAIANSRKYEVLSLVPDECLFMGELQRDTFKHPELATHYFELGYLAALKLAEYGFALKGDRLKVVQAYDQRPKTGYSLPDPQLQPLSPFTFAQGRSWKEILDLFHFSLLRSHLSASEGSADLPEKLGLKPSTYYAIKRRLSTLGYSFDLQDSSLPVMVKSKDMTPFKIYVSKLQELDWNTANKRFEGEIIEYLFKHAGYQKIRLAEDLGISYPTVLQKTKSLSLSD